MHAEIPGSRPGGSTRNKLLSMRFCRYIVIYFAKVKYWRLVFKPPVYNGVSEMINEMLKNIRLNGNYSKKS